MPPQTFDSDSESEPVNRKAPADVEMEDDIEEEGEGDGEDTGEDEYVVEAIKDHRFEGKVSYEAYVTWHASPFLNSPRISLSCNYRRAVLSNKSITLFLVNKVLA